MALFGNVDSAMLYGQFGFKPLNIVSQTRMNKKWQPKTFKGHFGTKPLKIMWLVPMGHPSAHRSWRTPNSLQFSFFWLDREHRNLLVANRWDIHAHEKNVFETTLNSFTAPRSFVNLIYGFGRPTWGAFFSFPSLNKNWRILWTPPSAHSFVSPHQANVASCSWKFRG